MVRALGVLGLLLACAAAQASFSPVGPPWDGEGSHGVAFEAYYSPSIAWMPLMNGRVDTDGNPVDWSNGVLTALRVDDFGLGGILDAASTTVGQTDDVVWQGGELELHAMAHWAGYAQTIGYREVGAANPTWLFNVVGDGTAVSGSALLSLPTSATFHFARGGDGDTVYSDPTANPAQMDRMVTYEIRGLQDGRKHWVIAFEDLPIFDHDYNDVMVEVVPVPEPASLLLLTLLPLALRRTR